jgi:hypothetical protein
VSLPFIDCPEVFGKTIKSLRLYPESVDGVEAIIEFADGTSLSWCTVRKSNTKATLFRSGIGAPEVLNEYDI